MDTNESCLTTSNMFEGITESRIDTQQNQAVIVKEPEYYFIKKERIRELSVVINEITEIFEHIVLNMSRNENYLELMLDEDVDDKNKIINDNKAKYIIEAILNDHKIYSETTLATVRRIFLKALEVRDYSLSDIQWISGLGNENFKKLISSDHLELLNDS